MRVPSSVWSGGELDPALWGRVDLNKYQTGLAFAENAVVKVEGGIEKRPGLYFVGYPKFQNKPAKLVPWRIADDDSYELEFGDYYVRFIRFGGHVLYPTTGFTPNPQSSAVNVGGFLEVPLPYPAAVVRELKYAYANDELYIFHKSYPPSKLIRLGLYDWKFVALDFNSLPVGVTSVTATFFTGDNDYNEQNRPIRYKVSVQLKSGQETLPSPPVEVQGDLGGAGNRVEIVFYKSTTLDVDRYVIYKELAGSYGYIGYIDGDEPNYDPASPGKVHFFDRNFGPSFAVVPIREFPGFGLGQYPRVGEFYKQRLAYAATAKAPQQLWFSKALFFSNLTTSRPVQDTDAIIATIVGNNRQTINHMLQLKKFIIFTDNGEWMVNSTDGPLSADSFNPVQETTYGSDPLLSPKAVGARVLFVQGISGQIFDLGFELASDSYQADELSRLSRHLFKNKKIVAWDYAAFPYNLFWTVFDDGSLAHMTYAREHEVWGWTHSVTQGKIFDVSVVSEIKESGSYFQVLRQINGVPTRTIERLESVFTDRAEDSFFVDCGLTFQDKREYSYLARVNDTQATLTCYSHGRVVGDEVQLETDQFILRFRVTLAMPDVLYLELRNPQDTLPVLDPESISGAIFMCGDEIKGFDHLEGQTDLVALADGKVIRDITITSGMFTLPFQAARVHCGFPYTGVVETLDLDTQGLAGQFVPKTIDEINIHLKNSAGVFIGSKTSARELLPLPSRSDEPYSAAARLLNGVYEISSHVSWEKTCGVRIELPDPLPATILNIVPDIVYGN